MRNYPLSMAEKPRLIQGCQMYEKDWKDLLNEIDSPQPKTKKRKKEERLENAVEEDEFDQLLN